MLDTQILANASYYSPLYSPPCRGTIRDFLLTSFLHFNVHNPYSLRWEVSIQIRG